MTAPRLELLVLKTAHVESVREFYTHVGFHFVEEQHGKGPRHYSAPLGDGVFEVYPLPEGAEADATTRLGFRVADLASVLLGLGNMSGPKQTVWGLRAMVRDPDGRTVELYETSRSDEVTDA